MEAALRRASAAPGPRSLAPTPHTAAPRQQCHPRGSVSSFGPKALQVAGGVPSQFSPPQGKCDLVLSSGFLAFASHSGFLAAVQQCGISVGGVMGTSAGALAGSLFCAGYNPVEVAKLLSERPPIELLRCSSNPLNGGFLSLGPVVERLYELLPPRFEDLNMDFAVGVVDASGEYHLLDSGPLPEAVAASAAIPIVFENVSVPGAGQSLGPFKDGGMYDRVGLKAWRSRRRHQLKARGDRSAPPPCLVHVISRSSPFSGADDVSQMGERDVLVVHSPKSGVNFFSLGDFEGQMNTALERSLTTLKSARRSSLMASA